MRYPDAHCELDFTSPFELLVATVLSAQTTDVSVNQTTPALFARYPDAAALAAANPEEVEEILRPHRVLPGQDEVGDGAVPGAGGAVPRARSPARLEDLVTLPGVGRKTANVVLGNAFGVPGITVGHALPAARRLRLG